MAGAKLAILLASGACSGSTSPVRKFGQKKTVMTVSFRAVCFFFHHTLSSALIVHDDK